MTGEISSFSRFSFSYLCLLNINFYLPWLFFSLFKKPEHKEIEEPKIKRKPRTTKWRCQWLPTPDDSYFLGSQSSVGNRHWYLRLVILLSFFFLLGVYFFLGFSLISHFLLFPVLLSFSFYLTLFGENERQRTGKRWEILKQRKNNKKEKKMGLDYGSHLAFTSSLLFSFYLRPFGWALLGANKKRERAKEM